MTAAPQCSHLRVEYLRRPLNVGTAYPRYSWLIDAPQQGYEVVVTRADDDAVIWHSGRVSSPQTSLVQHAGTPLEGCCAYRWKVRAWPAEGDPGPWAASLFETGPLAASDWQAPWVQPPQEPTTIERWSLADWIMGKGPDSDVQERLRPVQILRQDFRVTTAELTRARLYMTARGIYAAQLNGHPVGDETLAPGFDSYEHRVCAQTYDVTAQLTPGDNRLEVALADGWWAGRIGLPGSSAQWGDTTSATWQLRLWYDDGTTRIVLPDEHVVAAPGPWRYADLFIGEYYDRRQRPHRWTPVRVLHDRVDMITAFTGEPIRVIRELRPVAITQDATDGWIIDFGQVIAGRVHLTLHDPDPGQKITLEHTEILTPNGQWFTNIVGINKEQTDMYIAGGEPVETYEPTFTFHGFRYVRIRGQGTAPRSQDITAVVLSSDLPQVGEFHTNDARLNRLHQNVVWSQRANFLSVPTDCPQRERAGWTGDIQVFAASATNNALVAPFLARWLTNLRADQLPDGRIPITSPRSPVDIQAAETAEGIGAIVASAGWSDAIATVPWTLYERYGDTRVLEENYPALLRWIDYQQRTAREELVRDFSPEHEENQRFLYNTGTHFGDWLAPSTMTGTPHEAILVAPRLTAELVAPMFQAQTLTIASRIATVLGNDSDAADFAARAAAVRRAFAAEYVQGGQLPVPLQGLYVLAIAFDMAPQRDQLGRCLADLVRECGDRLDTGFLSFPHLLDALWDTGHRDVARRLLWQDQMPSWLYEVDRGATTIWENWDAVAADGTPRETSLNHYAFGAVDDWLYRRIAGIQARAPGFAEVALQPDLDCGLTDVSAHIDTVRGRVAVTWRVRENEAIVDVTIPTCVPGVLGVGDDWQALPAGLTRHHFSHYDGRWIPVDPVTLKEEK